MVKMLGSRLQTVSASRVKSLTVSATQRTRGGKWMRIRERILKRDQGLCQECKRHGRLALACIVDHITPLWAGGTDDDANLQSLCQTCSDEKTAQEATDRAAT